jgi:hypothetical protein
MRYRLIRIDPDPKNNRWTIYDSLIEGDRKDTPKPTPNALGFLYYPSTDSTAQAFNTLKKCMLKHHKIEIAKLTKSMNKLSNLKYNENKQA